MDINVKVRIVSPEIVAGLLAVAESLTQMKMGSAGTVEAGAMTENKELPAKEEGDKEETHKEETKTIALEDVRAKLASLSQSGKQAEVKALIKKYGARKLTDISKDKYSDLLKEAEGI